MTGQDFTGDQPTVRPPDATSAVVIGAGIAGLLAARVLSDHVDRVTVMERDRLPEVAVTRRGLAQSRHAHVLLLAGLDRLEQWFPGITTELTSAGAVPVEARDMVWFQGGDYQWRSDLGIVAMSMSRPLLETVIRVRLMRQCPNVTVSDQVLVDGPVLEGGRVVGVQVDGVTHRADLVVGCVGRHTRLLDQLAEQGFPSPEVASVRIDMTYGSCVVPRHPADLDGSLAVVAEEPAQGHRIGMMAAVEADRWIVSICSYHGEMPPTDMDEFEKYARTLPSPILADVLARADPQTVISTQRTASAQRRQMERLTRTPAGFVILGDALCSLNPVYAMGMSCAALQVQALAEALNRCAPDSARLPTRFYRRAARVIDGPWRLGVLADFTDPRTSGQKPPFVFLTNRYLAAVFRAGQRSPAVSGQVMKVHILAVKARTLATPAMVARVIWAGRRRSGR